MRLIAVRSSLITLPLRLSDAELAIRIRRAAKAGSDPTTRTTCSTEDLGSDRTRRTRTATSGNDGRSTFPPESSPAKARMKSNAVAYCIGAAVEDFCNWALVKSHARSHGFSCHRVDRSFKCRPDPARLEPGPRIPSRSTGCGRLAVKSLVHFAVAGTLRIAVALANGGQHPAPERYGRGIALVFDDFPVAREAVENQLGGVPADACASMRLADEELRHMVIDRRFPGGGHAGAGHQRKTHRFGALGDDQGMRVIVRKPIREDLILVRIAGAEDGEETCVQVGEGIEILRVDRLDPLAILLRVSAIANADEQRSRFPNALKDTARANEPRWPSARAWISNRSDYCFGADAAAAEAASAAALAAAAESAAAEAAESGAGVAAGGGVVSVVGAGASVLLPQALSTNAATKALNASLVFIYRYPRNLMITF